MESTAIDIKIASDQVCSYKDYYLFKSKQIMEFLKGLNKELDEKPGFFKEFLIKFIGFNRKPSN